MLSVSILHLRRLHRSPYYLIVASRDNPGITNRRQEINEAKEAKDGRTLDADLTRTPGVDRKASDGTHSSEDDILKATT